MLQPPSRRALLLIPAVAGIAAVTACTASTPPASVARVGAEQLAVRRVVADATRLRDAALSMVERYAPDTASRALYQSIAADHQAHLDALGAGARSSASPSASGTGSASGSAPASTTSGAASSSTSAGASGGASAGASPGPSAGASEAPDSPAALLAAEWEAAGDALRLGLGSDAGGLSQLLVRIAAARAAHADLIAAATRATPPGVLEPGPDPDAVPSPSPTGSAMPTGSPDASGSPTGPKPSGSAAPVSATLAAPASSTPSSTPSSTSSSPTASSGPFPSGPPSKSSTPSTRTPSVAPSPGSVLASPTDRALNRLLAGEHAAVYAYPVVIARTSGARRDLAATLWADHRNERDVLIERITSAGVDPVEAQAAYQISPVPGASRQAAQLAARLERGLAALATDVVATAEIGPDRIAGAAQLVLAARRTAAWAGHSDPLPGGPATVTSTPSATPSPGPTGTP